MPALFQASLIASNATADTAQRSRTIAASILIQLSLIAVILAVPIFLPQTLPLLPQSPRSIFFAPRKVALPPKPVRLTPQTASPLQTPSTAITQQASTPSITRTSAPTAEAAPSLIQWGTAMAADSGLPASLGTTSAPAVHVGSTAASGTSARQSKPLIVSSGVTAGLLIAPIRPVYPRLAIAAHQAGTVVVSAIIDKSGRITQLKVVSGPEMLRTAAVEAVSLARYRPFLLNGEPTEVETTISVNFRIEA